LELSFGELLLVAAIAFLVLGPTEMVRRANQLGRFMNRMRTEFNNIKIMTQEQILKGDPSEKIKSLEAQVMDPYRDFSHKVKKKMAVSEKASSPKEPDES
jgi:Sec-independent protein translocase protein TatA